MKLTPMMFSARFATAHAGTRNEADPGDVLSQIRHCTCGNKSGVRSLQEIKKNALGRILFLCNIRYIDIDLTARISNCIYLSRNKIVIISVVLKLPVVTHEGFVCAPFDKRMWMCVCLPQKFKKSRGGLMASLERDAKFVEKYVQVSFSPSSRSDRMRIHRGVCARLFVCRKSRKAGSLFPSGWRPLSPSGMIMNHM